MLYLLRLIVKFLLFCGRLGDSDVELRILFNLILFMVLGLGIMFEFDDVLSLRGGEIFLKFGKFCLNRRFRILFLSLLLV